MNLREFWAAEAAKLRDTSALLDVSALSPASTNKKVKSKDDDFQTGYWLEDYPNSNCLTIIFSTYVFNGTSASDAAVEALLRAAKRIFENFNQNDPVSEKEYYFEFRYKLVSEPRYESGTTYSTSEYSTNVNSKNQKLKKYMHKRDEVGILPQYYNSSQLPNEYYMEIFNEASAVNGVVTEGGASPNPNNRTKSAYFGLSIGVNVNRARVIVHEGLHPMLEHTWAKGSPIAFIWDRFFNSITKLIADKKAQGKSIAQYVAEIEREMKANTDNLKTDAAIIRENIMTTAGFIDETTYEEKGFYLFLGENIPMNYSNGTKIHPLQIQDIIKKTK
ncbi:MAG: hypothetical protein RLZZ628_2932 [Bacteroidota bacterium]|jgi:hypothetical protein